MDVSWVISLLLGLPVAMLATLKIIDWCKKRRAGNRAVQNEEQHNGEHTIKEQPSLAEPADQAIDPIIRQAELAADVDRQIAEDLNRYEVEHHHRNHTEGLLPRSK